MLLKFIAYLSFVFVVAPLISHEEVSSLETLYRFAISCNYASHEYLDIEEDVLVLVKIKSTKSLHKIITKVIDIADNCPYEEMPIAMASIRTIRDHFLKSDPISKSLNLEIERLDSCLYGYRFPFEIENEEKLWRLKFLSDLPTCLEVKQAPRANYENVFVWRDGVVDTRIVNEWTILELIGKKIYNSQIVYDSGEANWDEYQRLMMHYYKGSHFLIEDDSEGTLLTELRNQAIVRGSSHYERGHYIEGWDENGEPIYCGEGRENLLKAQTPQYGITGPHIKHILFSSVDIVENDDGDIIAGKSAEQVYHLIEAEKLYGWSPEETTVHPYVALQSESSPDSDGNDWLGFFEGRGCYFYTHRIAGFLTYSILKFFGIANANVGAYGFGRTDEDPIVLTQRNI